MRNSLLRVIFENPRVCQQLWNLHRTQSKLFTQFKLGWKSAITCIIFQRMPIYRSSRGDISPLEEYEKHVTLHEHFDEPREYKPRKYIAYHGRYISSRARFLNIFETELILILNLLISPTSFWPSLQPLLNDYSFFFQLKGHYFIQDKWRSFHSWTL